ncbi:hypothetical protein U6G28_10705 [Actinomycetaceae bacterium MB13-C1-2]|nr:hypothetical protein U6G28_10705 [Actinomycetaceae bacterium MB13-C1-2]
MTLGISDHPFGVGEASGSAIVQGDGYFPTGTDSYGLDLVDDGFFVPYGQVQGALAHGFDGFF